jgi:SAM-dependent methyltransferase
MSDPPCRANPTSPAAGKHAKESGSATPRAATDEDRDIRSGPHCDDRTLGRLLHDLAVAGDWHDEARTPRTTSPAGGFMDAAGWDERYAASDLVWSPGPNRTVANEVEGLTAGNALDLGAGEGRNALWLAEQGWTLTAVDFSAVGLAKAERLARQRGLALTTVIADVTRYHPEHTYDLVLIAYLQLPWTQLRKVLSTAVAALAPGGTLLLVAHDLANLAAGVGGPQDPAVLQTPDQVAAALPGLRVQKAERVRRPVEMDGRTRFAINTLVRAYASTPAS